MTVWRQAQRYEVPCIAFINKLDKPNSDLEMTLKSMKNKLGKEVILTQIPLKDQPLNGKWTLLTSIQIGRKIIFLPICFIYERARCPKSKIKRFYPRCKCHSHTHFQDDQTKNCKYFLKRVHFRLKLECVCVCNKAFLLKNIKLLFFTMYWYTSKTKTSVKIFLFSGCFPDLWQHFYVRQPHHPLAFLRLPYFV